MFIAVTPQLLSTIKKVNIVGRLIYRKKTIFIGKLT